MVYGIFCGLCVIEGRWAIAPWAAEKVQRHLCRVSSCTGIQIGTECDTSDSRAC